MRNHLAIFLLLALLAGCGQKDTTDPYANPGGAGDPYGYYNTAEITFLDGASSNATLDAGLTSLSFVNPAGEESLIRDLAPGKILVVVVTRGNTIPICPYCSTQTAQLIKNYDSFTERGAEVALIYPIETGDDSKRLDGFLTNVKTMLDDAATPVPFPVLLDVELRGVDKLGIRKDLSKPATYIIDAEGVVRYAYVGEHLADRPSVKTLLAELDQLAPADTPATDDAPAVDPEPAP